MSMRITGGSLCGRKVTAPKGLTTRPATDILRVALFNILKKHIEGSLVLDLFAGCGVLSFEALSRGAPFAVLVENNRSALKRILSNAENLNLRDRIHTIKSDALRCIPVIKHLHKTFRIVFIDPPYSLIRTEKTRRLLLQLTFGLYEEENLLSEDAVTMVRYPKGNDFYREFEGMLQILRRRHYGTTEFALLARKDVRIVLGSKHPFDRKTERRKKTP